MIMSLIRARQPGSINSRNPLGSFLLLECSALIDRYVLFAYFPTTYDGWRFRNAKPGDHVLIEVFDDDAGYVDLFVVTPHPGLSFKSR